MHTVAYPEFFCGGGVYMASDSEPIRGFGGFAPNGVKGQSPCRGSGGRRPSEAEAFLRKKLTILIILS